MKLAPLRYAISDRNSGFPPAEQVQLLAAEGLDFYQLREKDLATGELAQLARMILQVLAGTRTRLLLNSRPDVALAVGAHGVHLPSSPEELTPSEIHRLFAEAGRPVPSVSVSCHSLEDVGRLRSEPLAAILFGPVFGKNVRGAQVVPAVGLDLLQEACLLAAPVPVLALGGVTRENAARCLEAGAAGIAGIRLFQGALAGSAGATARQPVASYGG